MTTTSLYLDFHFDGGSRAEAQTVLVAAIDAAPIASALLRPAPGIVLEPDTARALISAAQKKGVAMLLGTDAAEAAKLGADGVHVPWSGDIVRAFKTLRQAAPSAIVGADAGRSRHEAMELGEAGADYIAFGIPPHVEDREKAGRRQLDLIQWWSELFEVPCVALDVPGPDAAQSLAAAGADFVAIRMASTETAEAAAARVREFAAAVRLPEPAK